MFSVKPSACRTFPSRSLQLGWRRSWLLFVLDTWLAAVLQQRRQSAAAAAAAGPAAAGRRPGHRLPAIHCRQVSKLAEVELRPLCPAWVFERQHLKRTHSWLLVGQAAAHPPSCDVCVVPFNAGITSRILLQGWLSGSARRHSSTSKPVLACKQRPWEQQQRHTGEAAGSDSPLEME